MQPQGIQTLMPQQGPQQGPAQPPVNPERLAAATSLVSNDAEKQILDPRTLAIIKYKDAVAAMQAADQLMQASQPAPTPPTVAERTEKAAQEGIMGMASRLSSGIQKQGGQMAASQAQQAVMSGGLPQLAAPNMAGMAQGGIVGYQTGGAVNPAPTPVQQIPRPIPKGQPSVAAQASATDDIARYMYLYRNMTAAMQQATTPQEKAEAQQQLQQMQQTFDPNVVAQAHMKMSGQGGMARGGVVGYQEGGDVEDEIVAYDELGNPIYASDIARAEFAKENAGLTPDDEESRARRAQYEAIRQRMEGRPDLSELAQTPTRPTTQASTRVPTAGYGMGDRTGQDEALMGILKGIGGLGKDTVTAMGEAISERVRSNRPQDRVMPGPESRRDPRSRLALKKPAVLLEDAPEDAETSAITTAPTTHRFSPELDLTRPTQTGTETGPTQTETRPTQTETSSGSTINLGSLGKQQDVEKRVRTEGLASLPGRPETAEEFAARRAARFEELTGAQGAIADRKAAEARRRELAEAQYSPEKERSRLLRAALAGLSRGGLRGLSEGYAAEEGQLSGERRTESERAVQEMDKIVAELRAMGLSQFEAENKALELWNNEEDRRRQRELQQEQINVQREQINNPTDLMQQINMRVDKIMQDKPGISRVDARFLALNQMEPTVTDGPGKDMLTAYKLAIEEHAADIINKDGLTVEDRFSKIYKKLFGGSPVTFGDTGDSSGSRFNVEVVPPNA